MATSLDDINAGFARHQQWDAKHGWTLNAAKSALLVAPQSVQCQGCECGAVMITRVGKCKLLGHELKTSYNAGSAVQRERLTRAHRIAQRVRVCAVHFQTAARVVRVAVLAAYRYGLEMTPTPKSFHNQLRVAIKSALGLKGRPLAWSIVIGVLNECQNLDPYYYGIEQHVMWLARGLRVAAIEGTRFHAQFAWEALARSRIANRKPRGPYMVFSAYMNELGVKFEPSWTISWHDSSVHMLNTPLNDIARFLRRAMQAHALQQAERRTRLVGVSHRKRVRSYRQRGQCA
eukprot:4559093-Amphidinium_carterae.2